MSLSRTVSDIYSDSLTGRKSYSFIAYSALCNAHNEADSVGIIIVKRGSVLAAKEFCRCVSPFCINSCWQT